MTGGAHMLDRASATDGSPQLRHESTSVEPSTAMQKVVDGHDADVRPMPEFTDVGADHEFPL